jgi:MYXO-CTERM domain-containing protein
MKKSWMIMAMLAVAAALVLGAGTAEAGIIVSQGSGTGSNLYTLLGLTGDSQDLCVLNAVPGTTINDTAVQSSGYYEWYISDGSFGTRSYDKISTNSPTDKVVYVIALKDRYIVNRIGFAAETVGYSTQLYVIDGLGGATINNYAVDLATDGVASNATLADSATLAGQTGGNIAYLGSASLGLKGTHVAFVSASTSGQPYNGEFVSLWEIAAAGTGFADAGGPYVMSPGGTLNLDASGSTYANTSLWNLDNDTNFDDASGVAPTISYSYLVNTLGLPTDTWLTIGLQVNGDTGTHTAYTTLFITAPPPVSEPAGLGLLGLALLGLRKRRN